MRKTKYLAFFLIFVGFLIIPSNVQAKESLGTCRYIVHDSNLQLDGFFPSDLYLTVKVYDDGSTGGRKIGFSGGWNAKPYSGLALGDTNFILMYDKMFDKNGDFYDAFVDNNNCPPMQFFTTPGTNNIEMRVKDFISPSPGQITYTATTTATGGSDDLSTPVYYCRDKKRTISVTGNGYIYLKVSTINRNGTKILSVSAYNKQNDESSLIASGEAEATQTLTLANGNFPLSFVVRNEDIDTYWSDSCSSADMYFEMIGGNESNLQMQTVEPDDINDATGAADEWEELSDNLDPNNFNNEITCPDIIDINTEGSVGWMLVTILNYIRIIGPVLVVLLSAIDFIKAVVGFDEKAMKEAQNKLIIRLVAAVLLFLVPTLVQVLLSFINATTCTLG